MLVRPDTFAQTFTTIFKFILQTGRAIRFQPQPFGAHEIPHRVTIDLQAAARQFSDQPRSVKAPVRHRSASHV